MEGTRNRELFGVDDLVPVRFAGVTARQGGTATLAVGAAHGATREASWAVYPQGTRRTEGARRLGTLRVTRVGALASEAEVVDEEPSGAITSGCRAVEEAAPAGAGALRVELQVPSGADEGRRLAEDIESNRLLGLVLPGQGGDVRVYLLPPRAEPAADDPVPQLGRLTTHTWVIIGTDGAVQAPPRPSSSPTAGLQVLDDLEVIARYRNALEIENRDPANPLSASVEMVLHRRLPDGRWVPALPEPGGGIAYHAGDVVGFTITNRTDRDLYVTVLDFGLTWRIGMLYPPDGRIEEPLKPGVTVRVAMDGSDDGAFTLDFPAGFPFVPTPDARPREGVEYFKAFVTSAPLDPEPLLQDAVSLSRGETDGAHLAEHPGADSPLGRLLALALAGMGTRDVVRKRRPAPEEWATVTHRIVLRDPAPSVELPGTDTPVVVGAVRIRAAGLLGRATATEPSSGRTRDLEAVAPGFEAVLEAEGVTVERSVEIEQAREVAPASRSTAQGEPALEVEVPGPGPGLGQMLLAADEGEVLTWNFAAAPVDGAREAQGDGWRTYRVRRAVPAADPSVGTRGLLGAAGKKLLKVLVFPLLDPLIGRVGEHFARKWEEARRPYRVRTFTPDDYARPDGREIVPAEWESLSSGRALLFVHGTFSRAHSAFGALPLDDVRRLHELYGGRVFALDHFTLSDDPFANARWFLSRIPAGLTLDVDIICHSRGGLVSRVLAERPDVGPEGSGRVRAHKVVFAAAPNAGTVLADTRHMGDMLDSYTNLLNFLPDNGVTDVLEGVITVAKQLAVGVVAGLPGLRSMVPDGDFVRQLNSGPRGDARYFALAADYEPTIPGWRDFVKDRLMDRVFGVENDLVVPTRGVHNLSGSGYFPIEGPLLFTKSDGVAHSGFFGSRAAREKIFEWLQA